MRQGAPAAGAATGQTLGHGGTQPTLPRLGIAACLIVALGVSPVIAQEQLEAIRDEVRSGSSSSSLASIHDDHSDDDDDDSLFGSIVGGFLGSLLSSSSNDDCKTRSHVRQHSVPQCSVPQYWDNSSVYMSDTMLKEWSAGARGSVAPDFERRVLVDLPAPSHFPRYPYQHANGYMVSNLWPAGVGNSFGNAFHPDPFDCDLWPTRPRRWAARVRADYGDSLDDDITRIGGHLLLSTSSRWGLDTEMSYLKETFSGGGEDHLWIGDCNVVYRFAQSERMQWRTGLGFNWLDDPVDTDFGFNFTLGADFYPKKPWILSGTLDWGTLGHAEFFKFRSTVGVILYGMETYAGIEYYDIGDTQISSLIGGVRVWF